MSLRELVRGLLLQDLRWRNITVMEKARVQVRIFFSLLIIFSVLHKPVRKFPPFLEGCLLQWVISLLWLQGCGCCRRGLLQPKTDPSLLYRQSTYLRMT